MRAFETDSLLDPAWHEAIAVRTSRRAFTGEPLQPQVAEQLRTFGERFTLFDNVRVAFVEHAPDELFTGLVGSYGRIDGAPSAALLTGPREALNEMGYAGEAFVLEATRLGVDTCWIAGAFSRKRAATLVPLSEGEQVPAIIAVGTATEGHSVTERAIRAYARATARLPIEDLVENLGPGASWPAWAVSAVEAARLAPSGGNSQPWRFRLEGGTLVLSRTKLAYPTVAIDLGIAMLHADLGAQHEGVRGRWEPVLDQGVARFVPDGAVA